MSIGELDTCECLSSSDDMASLMLPAVAATELVSELEIPISNWSAIP